jgi:CHASE2 domain-containing sensor protein/CheY-like chemotaxis protein/nitrogen-specific signal transduction histidine kinase
MKNKLNQLFQPNIFAISLTISVCTILLSLTGTFQMLEWMIFDQFFRWRPQIYQDKNIIIVSIDENDIAKAGRWPISDLTLTELLAKIKQQKPRVIGLDIFRDLAVEPGHQELVTLMESTPNLIGIEKVIGNNPRDKVAPPPTLARLNQIAAADLISDEDGKIRRALLSLKSENNDTILGIGTKLALMYLEDENITLEYLNSQNGKSRLGKTIILPLQKNDGAYINADVGGYQILLNYLGKSCLADSCPFTTISMTDVLKGKVAPNLMTDKIVLIGNTARSISDFFYYPYSYSDGSTISGVEIHAHIASLIVNAGLNNNYLFKSIPEYLEWLWLIFFATTGGIVTANSVNNKKQIVLVVFLAFLLVFSTYVLFLLNFWIPLVTPFAAFLSSVIASLVYTLWHNLNLSYRKLEQYASDLEMEVQEKTQDLLNKKRELENKNLELESNNLELIKARKSAEKANATKSIFLASMSHELRTPLNAIIGFSQLMNKDKQLNQEQREFVSTINRSGEHLLSLIDDILDLSKIEAGKITVNKNNFDFLQMLNTVKKMLLMKAKNKNLSFIFKIDQNVPRYICTDERRLKQILINLVNNAIKFTHTGFVKLHVFLGDDRLSSENQESSNHKRRIIFSVEDTGQGINVEDKAKLFQPFEQTETGIKSKEGTGLGLAISRKFINLLGGDIQVKSQANRGTTFTFDIQVEKIEPQEIISETQQKIIGLNQTQETPKILVVDDSPDNTYLLLNILKPIGFLVRTAHNGKEAIEIWEDWQPDLILMDLQMPIISGYEAVNLIREQENNLPRYRVKILAVTASLIDEYDHKITCLGFDGLIHKPFTEKIILEEVKDQLKLDYIYEQEHRDNNHVKNIHNLLEDRALIAEVTRMPTHWLQQVLASANRGSDDELLDLVREIPADLRVLQEVFSRLIHEYMFEEIINLVSSVDS